MHWPEFSLETEDIVVNKMSFMFMNLLEREEWINKQFQAEMINSVMEKVLDAMKTWGDIKLRFRNQI